MPQERALNDTAGQDTIIGEFHAKPQSLRSCVFMTCMIPLMAATAIWLAFLDPVPKSITERSIVFAIFFIYGVPLTTILSWYGWRTRTLPQRVAVTHNSVIVPKLGWTGIHTAELEIHFDEIARLTNDRVPSGCNPEGGRLRIWLHGVRHPLPYLGLPLHAKERIAFSLLLKQSLAQWQREQNQLNEGETY